MKTHKLIAILTGIAACMGTRGAATNTFPASGNVGIGTTSPQALLEIKKPSGGRWQFVDEGADVYQAINIRNAANTAFLPLTIRGLGFEINDGVAARLSISSSGNVGIGTTAPGARLDIQNANSGSGTDLAHIVNSANDATGNFAELMLATSGQTLTANREVRIRATMSGSSTTDLTFFTADTARMTILSGGNVGIGTTSPSSTLDVNGMITVRGSNVLNLAYSGGAATITEGYGTELRGDTNHPIQILGGALLVNYDATGATYGTSGLFVNGNVGIGTTNPTYPLTVNGTVRAKEVIVDTGWSDFVFAPGYRLTPLSEIEQHIKAEKHLPGIPSAQEIAQGGVSLGDMQARLLQKVEELTLYVIELKKENTEMKKDLEQLKTPAH